MSFWRRMFGKGSREKLQPPAARLSQRGPGPGAPGRLRGGADLLSAGLSGQSRPIRASCSTWPSRSPRPASRKRPSATTSARWSWTTAWAARTTASPSAAQAGRRAAGRRAPARLSRPAAQGTRRRALGPPRRERAAGDREQPGAGDAVNPLGSSSSLASLAGLQQSDRRRGRSGGAGDPASRRSDSIEVGEIAAALPPGRSTRTAIRWMRRSPGGRPTRR